MSNEKNFEILRRDGDHKWSSIDLSTYSADRTTILVLGGSGTNDDIATKGNANIISTMLGVFNQDVDLLTINYNNVKLVVDDCTKLVNALFLPQISKNGKKLDLDLACKNMRRFNIFAHCFGAMVVLSELIWQLSVALTKLDYTDEEQALITKQIFTVSYASKYMPDEVTGLEVLSVNESVFLREGLGLAQKFFKNLDKIKMSPYDYNKFKYGDELENMQFINESDRCYVMPDENKISLVASTFSNSGSYDDHTMTPLKRTENWGKHESATPTGDVVSKCVGASLCNAVANSILNLKSEKHIPFKLEELREQLDLVCKKINSKIVENNFEV